MKNSKIYNLISSLNNLPGIGKKSAIKISYSLIAKREESLKLLNSIEEALVSIYECRECNNISENEICYICSDETRERKKVCLVESSKDIYILEENRFYKGLYFVFDNIKNSNNIDKLKEFISKNRSSDITFAFTPSVATDMLAMFIEDQLSSFDINFYMIAQGIPSGVSLENVDTLSLDKAFTNKTVL